MAWYVFSEVHYFIKNLNSFLFIEPTYYSKDSYESDAIKIVQLFIYRRWRQTICLRARMLLL